MSLDERSLRDSGDANGSDEAATFFARSVEQSASYPTNLVYPHSYDYQLKECQKQLDDNQENLFGDENVVDFLEMNEEDTGTYLWQSWQA